MGMVPVRTQGRQAISPAHGATGAPTAVCPSTATEAAAAIRPTTTETVILYRSNDQSKCSLAV